MYCSLTMPLVPTCAPRRVWNVLLVLTISILIFTVHTGRAQHVTNPYAGATQYVSPDWANEVKSVAAAQTSGSTLANQMYVVAGYPTAVWLDHIGAIYGGAANSGRLSLSQHIADALAQQSGSTPIVVTLVIYDLPDRDCAALASNGELSIAGGDTVIGSTGASETLTGTGLQEYENNYITPIYNILSQYASNSNIRFVLVVEDDSLPSMITNTGKSFSLANCIAANNGQTNTSGSDVSMSGVYVQGIAYAINTFHPLSNVYTYLDVGHHGWLGWPSNLAAAVTFFHNFATQELTDGVSSIDGFITNTANYGALKEPYMSWNTAVGGTGASNEVYSSSFFQWNPEIDEEDYANDLWTLLTTPTTTTVTLKDNSTTVAGGGFPSTLGFLIDTSRNGWGSSLRPTGASTSTSLNTFVDASKIDLRTDMGQWCNQPNAGLGVPPTANPGGFANLSAYVWIKPPGESDGNYPGSVWNGVTSTTGDSNCNPTHDNALANNEPTDAVANSPQAGTFWPAYFTTLVQNADPVVSSSTSPSFTITASAVSVEQGTSATDSVTVSAINGFTGTVALTVSGLPTGVTASYSPASVSGSSGSTLTFTATNTATVGTSTVTITGTSGSTVETTTLTLTVTAEPNFTISVSPTSLSLPPNSNPTATVTVSFVGGLTGNVALSTANLPSGVNANFNPSSLNTSGTSTVNFTSQSSTPAGTTNISIVGTDGSITHSTTLALIVPSSGFTLTSSSSTVSLAPSASTTDTITVTDVGSFTGSVTLSASGLPSGVTAAFGSNPTTGSSILTLTASSSVATGSYTVTVTGVSGSTTETTTFTLTVPSSGFTLTPSATAVSVTQGASATDTITVTDAGSFTGSVTLSASGLPSGVTAAFGTNPTTGSSILTLTASSSAATGSYTVTVTGVSGSTTETTTFTLTVNSATGSLGCHVTYTISSQWSGEFGASIALENTGSTAWTSWTLTWTFANGQTITQLWNGTATQSGANVAITNLSYNGAVAAGATYSGMGFNGTWNNTTNAVPTAFAVNGNACK